MRCHLYFKSCVLAVLWLAAAFARAHEHWIMADAIDWQDGAVRLIVGSGHHFPVSQTLLSERLLSEITLYPPDAAASRHRPVASGNAWMHEFAAGQAGVWRAEFSLARPPAGTPFHLGRTIMIVDAADDPRAYVSRQGLEIEPAAALAALQPGDELPLRILLDGHAIAGTVVVFSAAGPMVRLSTTPARPARLRIRRPDDYLLTTSADGRSFSLTFRVVTRTGDAQP